MGNKTKKPNIIKRGVKGMTDVVNVVKVGGKLMKAIGPKEALGLIGPLRDTLDNLAKNPQILDATLGILKELTEDDRISQGLSNVLALSGAWIKLAGNAMTPEVVQMTHEIVKDKQVKDGIAALLSTIDPEVYADLLPVIGSVIGALGTEISKNEKAKKALIGMISNTGAFMKELTTTLLGETVPLGEKK